MPLPPAPTQRPNNAATRQSDRKSNNELLQKGVLCALIGVCVLIAPYFLRSADMQAIVGGASLVGWFALVLGGALVAMYARRRVAAASKG